MGDQSKSVEGVQGDDDTVTLKDKLIKAMNKLKVKLSNPKNGLKVEFIDDAMAALKKVLDGMDNFLSIEENQSKSVEGVQVKDDTTLKEKLTTAMNKLKVKLSDPKNGLKLELIDDAM